LQRLFVLQNTEHPAFALHNTRPKSPNILNHVRAFVAGFLSTYAPNFAKEVKYRVDVLLKIIKLAGRK